MQQYSTLLPFRLDDVTPYCDVIGDAGAASIIAAAKVARRVTEDPDTETLLSMIAHAAAFYSSATALGFDVSDTFEGIHEAFLAGEFKSPR